MKLASMTYGRSAGVQWPSNAGEIDIMEQYGDEQQCCRVCYARAFLRCYYCRSGVAMQSRGTTGATIAQRG